MIKANTTIIVGGKIIHAGQTVSGLSKLDRKWMLEAGYITETSSRKEEKEQPTREEEKADEQL